MANLSVLVRAALAAFLPALMSLSACGSGEDDDAPADRRCLTIKDQYDQPHKLCCKQADEVATYRTACSLHVAIGCEGPLACIFYSDDGEVAHACHSAPTCGQCARQGDTGLELWCSNQ